MVTEVQCKYNFLCLFSFSTMWDFINVGHLSQKSIRRRRSGHELLEVILGSFQCGTINGRRVLHRYDNRSFHLYVVKKIAILQK